MELINSRYKILDCIEQDHYYSQYLALDLIKKGEKVSLYLIQDTQTTKPFIEYCNSNFYEISSYKQESIMNVYSYGIVETIDDKFIEETIFFYTAEYIEGIALLDLEKPLNECEILEIYKQLSPALDFLYFHGLVYKYLGVETLNIIRKDGKFIVKLSDIISIYRIEVLKPYSHPISRSFFAPEIWNGRDIGVYSDIYSLGSLIYYLMTLKMLDYKDLTSSTSDNNIKMQLFTMIYKMTSNDIHTRYQSIQECNDNIVKIYGMDEIIEQLRDVDKINFKTPLVGRDRELTQILDVCGTMEGKLGKFKKNLVLINGDKGIGKSRLLKEVDHLMKWRKYKTFHIAINKNDEGFREIIGTLVKQFIKISSEFYITKYGMELVKLVPELGINRDIRPSSVLPAEQEILRLYDRVANFMLDVSTIHPCVILVDKFNVADVTMMEFIDYLLNLNKIKKAPLLLVLFYRENNFYFNEYENYMNKWNSDNTLSIKLSRLTIAETAKMVKHILGWHKEPLIFASRIMKNTEGNPGYIEEIIKELYAQGMLEFTYSTKYRGFAPSIVIDDYDKIILSENIDNSILKQVNSLDNTSKEILTIVSLFNTSISKDIIVSMTEINEDEFDDCLLDLTQLKILNEKFDDWGYTYGFHSNDFKNQIYNNIDETRRTYLHIQASNILEDLYMKDGRENKDELIFHLIQSNQKCKSIDYCIESGIGMLKRLAYEQAYSIFKRAYELLESDLDPRKLTVLIHLGKISQKLLKNNNAIYYLNYAIELASLQNKPNEYINAKISIGLIYSIRNEFGLAQSYFTESIKKAKEIQYFKGVMEAAYLLGRIYMHTRDLQKLKDISEEHFNYSLDKNDLYYMGMFTGLKGIVEYMEENILASLKLFKKSVDYLEKAGEIEETARPINNIGVIYNDHFQNTQEAREYFQKALTISEQYRKTDGIITFSNNIADTYLAEKDYIKAIEVLNKSLDLALEYEDEMFILLLYNNLIIGYTCIGEYNQAYNYLLKAEKIFKSKNSNNDYGMHLENFLESCANLYIEMGAYNEALETIEKFFEKFPNAELPIKLRMQKLFYFSKYYAGKDVEDKEILSLIEIYRDTSYVRDRRVLLLEAAEHFTNKHMLSQTKRILDEDSNLMNVTNNSYFILKRKYIECFLLKTEDQITALEDLLLNKELDLFNEMQWKILARLGMLYMQSSAYYRSINRLVEALDIMYVLFNKTPLEFNKVYLFKDNKFLVRATLFKIEELINVEKSEGHKVYDKIDCEKYRTELLLEKNIEDFFDISELQNILNNKTFYDLAMEYYDKFNENKITNVEQLVASFTENNVENLNALLNLICRRTLASRGAIIEEEGYKIVASLGQNISKERINIILEEIPNVRKEIFRNNNLNKIRQTNRDYLLNDTRGLICLPIYKEFGNRQDESIKENNRKNYNGLQNKILGYLYLETDKALNNFTREALGFCKDLLPLVGLLLTNQYLTRFSFVDKMTGTYMRKYFEQIFEEEIEHASEINQPLSIIMLDIDHFKSVNDLYGHQKGDSVLTAVGQIIRNSIRSTDHVGRYGGEEFIILLPGANKKDGFNIAEKIRTKIESSNLLGNDTPLTISCGISTFPWDGNKQINIIEKADQALYDAKENGRNRSTTWNNSIIQGSKRVDKLAGIVTGNNVQDQRNVLVITEIIDLISSDICVKDKIFTILGRLIEILEAEEGILFTVDNSKINERYYRRRFVEDWVAPFVYNEFIIRRSILSMEGKYTIDWENMNDLDPLTNTPNWKSVIVIPIVVNQIVCGVIYLSVPIKEKEFDYAEYNLVDITTNVIGAILKTSNTDNL